MLIFFLTGATLDTPNWTQNDDIVAQDIGVVGMGNMNEPGSAPITYNGSPLRLMNNDHLILTEEGLIADGITNLTFSIIPMEGYEDGQLIAYGYIDGENLFHTIDTARISEGTEISIDHSKLKGGLICIRNISVDSIYLKNISIDAECHQ